MTDKIFQWNVLSLLSVHDGDTAHFHMQSKKETVVDLGFGMITRVRGETDEFQCRSEGYASLELKNPGGKEARDFYLSLIDHDLEELMVESLKWDKYAPRFDGRVYRNGIWLGQIMIEAGYALPWNGKGTQPKPVWPIPKGQL